jgi:hypothetical protein
MVLRWEDQIICAVLTGVTNAPVNIHLSMAGRG